MGTLDSAAVLPERRVSHRIYGAVGVFSKRDGGRRLGGRASQGEVAGSGACWT